MALNQEEIVKGAYGDSMGTTANSVFSNRNLFYDKDVKGYEQNLDEAKKLAQSSGLAGKTITLHYNTDRSYMEATALLIQEQLKAIDVNVDIGTISGYMGGAVDAFMMRIVDVFMSVPSLLFIIVVYAFMPRNLVTLVGMLAFFSWTKVARVVRAQTLTLKERDFVIAAKALGVSQGTIIRKHIIPNLMPQIIVSASLSIANAILDESTLSFLGYGVQLPMASWGSMLQTAQKFILHNPIMAVAPGVMILVTVLCFNVLGDMLQQMLDPKLVK